MTAQREIVRRFVEGQSGVLEREFSEVESGRKTDEERPPVGRDTGLREESQGDFGNRETGPIGSKR